MKKIFASLLGIVVFFLLVPAGTIIIARDLFGENTVEKVLEVAPELLDETASGESLADLFISRLEEIEPTFSKNLDEEELQKELAKMFSSMFENLGNPETKYIFDTSGMEEYFKKAIKEYEKETGITFPDEEIDSFVEKINENNPKREEIVQDFPEIIAIFEILYSNKIQVSLITGIILCIILMLVLLADIPLTLAKVKTPFLVHGIGTLLIAFGISGLLSSAEVTSGVNPKELVGILTAPFFKVGVVSIAISVVLMIISKVLKHNKSISNSNAALENLGNTTYIPSTNISNTPYNGYQNH